MRRPNLFILAAAQSALYFSATHAQEMESPPPPQFTPSAPVTRGSLTNNPNGIKPEGARPSEERPTNKIKSGDLVNMDYVNADIAEVTRSIAEITKRNFILDDQVHGKITIISPKPVTVEEAYQAYISALSVKNFTVVPAGRMLKIVPLRDMKQNPIPTEVDRALGGDDAYVTRLIPIRYTSAAEIVKALRGLLTKNGDVMSYDPTNTLIVTDAVGNLRRMIKIIDKLDQRGYQESLEVIKLHYASAVDVTQKIMQIFDLKDIANRQPAAPGTPEAANTSQFISKIIPDDRTNSIVVMANQEGIRRVRDVIKTFDRALEAETEKGRIHVHYLQYADASELVGTLSSLTTGGPGNAPRRPASPGGNRSRNNTMFPVPGQPPNIPQPQQAQGVSSASLEGAALFDGDVHLTADIPTNSLVITASPSDFRSLIPVIQKLDIRRPQCFVEAMIMEVDIDKALDIGIANHIGKQFNNGQTTMFGATNFGDKSSLFLPTQTSALQGLAFGVQGRSIDIPVAGGQKLTIPVYGSLFRALQTNGTINVLSTPNILTSDNKEAEIIVGQVIPFVVAQGRDINNQPINQIQRENVAITLRVTPQINESDDVTMDIFQEIQDLVPGTDINVNGPSTTNRSAKTSVLVKNAQTVTVGGLISDRDQTSISKVPVLGDIPLIGWFFKNKSRTKRKTSLVIFITPHIIRNPDDLEEMSIQKNTERQNFLRENNVEDHGGVKKYNLDKSLKVPKNKSVPQYDGQPVPLGSPTGNFLPPVSDVKPAPEIKTAPVTETNPEPAPEVSPIPMPSSSFPAPTFKEEDAR